MTLGNVVLHFSELPDEVTQILIGVKAVHDDTDDTFTEIGRFVVVAGSVSIPLAYTDLVYYFGVTHYSIWFQVIGGNNEEGTVCGTIALSGVMPGGHNVYLSKRVCSGTNPVPAPSTPTTTLGNTAPVASGVSISGGTRYIGETLTGNYTYTDAEGDPEGVSMYQWYRDGTAIGGATNQTYTVQVADLGKCLYFEVVPVTQTGTSPGSAAKSACFRIPWPIILYNAGLHDGDLDGRIGADLLCLTAKPASLPASYTNVKAFISVQNGDAIFDLMILTPIDAPIRSVGGTLLFTDRFDMLDGDNPTTSLLAAGVTPTNTQWWSGSTVTGTYFSGEDECANWTTNAGGGTWMGMVGSTDSPPSGLHWMGNGVLWYCDMQRYLLCITYGL